MRITLLTGKTFDIQKALSMDIKIIKSAKAKRLTLRIDAKERLPILTLPSRCSGKRAVAFVEEHRRWIEENLAKIPVAKRFENGEIISVMGKEYNINHCPQKRCGVMIEDHELIVSGAKEYPAAEGGVDFRSKRVQKSAWRSFSPGAGQRGAGSLAQLLTQNKFCHHAEKGDDDELQDKKDYL